VLVAPHRAAPTPSEAGGGGYVVGSLKHILSLSRIHSPGQREQAPGPQSGEGAVVAIDGGPRDTADRGGVTMPPRGSESAGASPPLCDRITIPRGLVRDRLTIMGRGLSRDAYYKQWSTAEMDPPPPEITMANWETPGDDCITVDCLMTHGTAASHRDLLVRRWGESAGVSLLAGRTILRSFHHDRCGHHIPILTVGEQDLNVVRLAPEMVGGWVDAVEKLTNNELCRTDTLRKALGGGVGTLSKRVTLMKGVHKGLELGEVMTTLIEVCGDSSAVSLCGFADKRCFVSHLPETFDEYKSAFVDLRRVSHVRTNVPDAHYVAGLRLDTLKDICCAMGPTGAASRFWFRRRAGDRKRRVRSDGRVKHAAAFPGTRRVSAYPVYTSSTMSYAHGGATMRPTKGPRREGRRSSSSTSEGSSTTSGSESESDGESSDSEERGDDYPYGRVAKVDFYNK
jgi:hypothetical protein